MSPAIPQSPPTLSRKKRLIFSAVTALFCVGVLFLVYLGYVAQRSRQVYSYAKDDERGWSGRIHQADPELGYTTVANARGTEVIPAGPDIPVRHDKDGFRIPVEEPAVTASARRPIVLTLGCSFTYGATNLAEDTYAYLLGQYLGGTTRNGGVCGYGSSQMLILARRLVPAIKPDYLVVQYSRWLTERALSPFAPAYFGKVPTPFFYHRRGEVALHQPVFRSKTMDVPVDQYRGYPKTVLDFAAFVGNVGLPLLAYDDFHMLAYRGGAWSGKYPEAMSRQRLHQFIDANRHEVDQFVYRSIADVVKGTHTKLVAVVIGSGEPVAYDGVFPADYLVVDAQKALLDRLAAVSKETYQKEYGYWRGNPPQLIDGFHPNAIAHRVIARTVADKIREWEAKSSSLDARGSGTRLGQIASAR